MVIALAVASVMSEPASAVEQIRIDEDEQLTQTEDFSFITENVGQGSAAYTGIRVNANGQLLVKSDNAFVTVKNFPDENGQGDYTAFGLKVDGNQGASAVFSGENVTINTRGAYGAQSVSFPNAGALSSTLDFNNSGNLDIVAIIEDDGIANSNAIGIIGNGQNIKFSNPNQAVNIAVYGSGMFSGNALGSNGTSGAFFANDTVTINSKTFNISVIAGQDYTARLQTAPNSFENVSVKFDQEAAKASGASYGVTYGLNNKGFTTISADTRTTISVNDGFWTAVGISNDPMFVDFDHTGNFSNYNASELKILGDLSLQVSGSSLGDANDAILTGGSTQYAFQRLTSTYGLYAAVSQMDGVDGYEAQTSHVVLGSDGKAVSFFVSNDTKGADGDVYGIYGAKGDISINGATASINVQSSTMGTAYGVALETESKLIFSDDLTEISVKGESAIGVSSKGTNTTVQFKGKESSIDAQGSESTALKLSEGGNAVFAGTTVLSAAQAISADSQSTLVIEGSDGALASLTAEGLVQNLGTTKLTRGMLMMTTSGSSLNQVMASDSTIGVAAGTYSIASFLGSNNTLLATDLEHLAKANVSAASNDLTVAASGGSNDQFSNANETYQALRNKIAIGTAVDQTANRYVIEAGAVNDGLEATKAADGTWHMKVHENASMAGYSDVASLSALTWRNQINDVSKRMGDLRDQPGSTGAWVRVYGSSQEFGALSNKSTSVQAGADYQIGSWKIGGTFSYTNGASSFDLGDADHDIYTVGLYGTWMAKNGLFFDLIGKVGRLSNDFQVNSMHGSYSNTAFSFSAEAGWRFEPCGYGFIEPQAELTYGRIVGDSFTTNNQVRVDQENFDSVIGRIGVRVGANFPDNRGNIYLRVSGAYDFQGENQANVRLVSAAAQRTLQADLGGAWIETAIGANVHVTEATNVYLDLERTNGGDVVENWRWNVGVRHLF